MSRRILSGLLVILMLGVTYGVALAARNSDDEDTRLVNVKVEEVTDGHISVMTSSREEHVIAVDRAGTRVTRNGRLVSIREVREGDIITVELDANKQVKFAKNISIGRAPTEVARRNRR